MTYRILRIIGARSQYVPPRESRESYDFAPVCGDCDRSGDGPVHKPGPDDWYQYTCHCRVCGRALDVVATYGVGG